MTPVKQGKTLPAVRQRLSPVHVNGLHFRVNFVTNCRSGCKLMATSPQAAPLGVETFPWGGPGRCAECQDWVEIVSVTVEGPFVDAHWLEPLLERAK